MTRIDRMIADLQKLYAKRSALDTQIQGIEMSLVAEVKTYTKPSVLATKPAAKPAAKKTEAKKPEAKKPAAAKK